MRNDVLYLCPSTATAIKPMTKEHDGTQSHDTGGLTHLGEARGFLLTSLSAFVIQIDPEEPGT